MPVIDRPKLGGVSRLSTIAHPWETIVAGAFAGRYPALVDRLVFFAPIGRRPLAPSPRACRPGGSFRKGSGERFAADVSPQSPPVLSTRHFAQWGV